MTRTDLLNTLQFSLNFIHLTGRKQTVTYQGIEQTNQIILDMAKHGYTTDQFPAGGMVLPLRMFPVVDFTLLGFTRKYERPDGESKKLALVKEPHHYVHRLMEADKKTKMPFKLSFSRGAKQFDDPVIVEGTDNFKYITAIQFIGKGRIIPDLCIPGTLSSDNTVLKVVNTLPDQEDQEKLNKELDTLNAQHAEQVKQYNQRRNQHN